MRRKSAGGTTAGTGSFFSGSLYGWSGHQAHRSRRNRWTGSSNEDPGDITRRAKGRQHEDDEWKRLAPLYGGSWPRLFGFAKRPRKLITSHPAGPLPLRAAHCAKWKNTTASASGTHRGWESGGELRNMAGSGHGPWHLARSKSPLRGTLQCPLQIARPTLPCSKRVSVTSRTAVYGPVRTVVWEGRRREALPYPIVSARLSAVR